MCKFWLKTVVRRRLRKQAGGKRDTLPRVGDKEEWRLDIMLVNNIRTCVYYVFVYLVCVSGGWSLYILQT